MLGLSLVQKKIKRTSYLDFDDEISISVREMEGALIQHFDDRSIKVVLVIRTSTHRNIASDFKYEDEEREDRTWAL